MKKLQKKQAALARRHRRVRGKISGTAARPRLCVTRSNSNIYVQFVDDVAGKTLLGVSTLGPDFKATGKNGANVEGAAAMGEIAGKKPSKPVSPKSSSTAAATCTMAVLRLWQRVLVKPA